MQIKLNGRTVEVTHCPECNERVFSGKVLYGCLVELDGTCHKCPER